MAEVTMDGVIILHLMAEVMAAVAAHSGITTQVFLVVITKVAAVDQVTIHQKTQVVEVEVDSALLDVKETERKSNK